jgi:hypothetical protein
MRRFLLLLAIALGAACAIEEPHSPDATLTARRPPPKKPGESITHTMMCSCRVCEPTSCCHELDQDRPELESCADGYDFSRCGMSVTSCDSRCFQHRWRTQVEAGCQASRPDRCCHDQGDM